jgi:D-alanyl-D-alanine dipeptidase
MPPLVTITQQKYDVLLDIVYATCNNFTGAKIYQHPLCYLHPKAAEHLEKAVKIARALGYRLKIFDAYRPTEAQWKMWRHTPDPTFLADPAKGSPHSRGVAIDLTLCDDNGNELDMGTAFDAFTPLSFHGVTEISIEAQRNRLMLLGIMSAAGWDFYSKEWWHYQLFNSRQYPLVSDSALPERMME